MISETLATQALVSGDRHLYYAPKKVAPFYSRYSVFKQQSLTRSAERAVRWLAASLGYHTLLAPERSALLYPLTRADPDN